MQKIQERWRDENKVKMTHFCATITTRIITLGKIVGSYMASLQISLEKIMIAGEEIHVTSSKVMLLI